MITCKTANENHQKRNIFLVENVLSRNAFPRAIAHYFDITFQIISFFNIEPIRWRAAKILGFDQAAAMSRTSVFYGQACKK